MSRKELVSEFGKLSEIEKYALLKELNQQQEKAVSVLKTRNLTELAGLGKELWAGVDTEQYIKDERNWDRDSLGK